MKLFVVGTADNRIFEPKGYFDGGPLFSTDVKLCPLDEIENIDIVKNIIEKYEGDWESLSLQEKGQYIEKNTSTDCIRVLFFDTEDKAKMYLTGVLKAIEERENQIEYSHTTESDAEVWKLKEDEVEVPDGFELASRLEKELNLCPGLIRQAIYRKRIDEQDRVKVLGRWFVNRDSAKNLWG